ncbi:MAG: hypothetical protein R2847_00040 [Bacteroidia bacterium]
MVPYGSPQSVVKEVNKEISLCTNNPFAYDTFEALIISVKATPIQSGMSGIRKLAGQTAIYGLSGIMDVCSITCWFRFIRIFCLWVWYSI